MIIDLHVHSKYSGDNRSEPEPIIEEALRKKLDGIMIAEHHSYEASEPWEAYIRDRKKNGGLYIFRAVEISTTAGHVIGIGLKDDSWNTYRVDGCYLEMEEVLAKIRANHGVSIIAHPYRENIDCPLMERFEKLEGYTAAEGINGGCTPEENRRAVDWLIRNGRPFTGGSDAHKPERVGRAFTRFTNPVCTLDDLIRELKAGHYQGYYFDAETIHRLPDGR